MENTIIYKKVTFDQDGKVTLVEFYNSFDGTTYSNKIRETSYSYDVDGKIISTTTTNF